MNLLSGFFWWMLICRFCDCCDVGCVLVDEFVFYCGRDWLFVFGFVCGGVFVGWEVVLVLGVELDVFLVCKFGVL